MKKSFGQRNIPKEEQIKVNYAARESEDLDFENPIIYALSCLTVHTSFIPPPLSRYTFIIKCLFFIRNVARVQ